MVAGSNQSCKLEYVVISCSFRVPISSAIMAVGFFTVVSFVGKPLIWSKAEVDHVVIETIIWLA